MPEGPEIKRAADRLAKVLEGQKVEVVYFRLPRLQPFSQALAQHKITAVRTLGKALLTAFDNGLTLYSHNQLYGRWYVQKRDQLPNTSRSLRVALHTARHSALLYSASEIDVLTDEEITEHPFLRNLGPDLLDTTLTWQDIADRLNSKAFRRRAVAGLYLDQQYLAGVGNYLRSEILFAAGVHPWSTPAGLTRGALGKLARASLSIGLRAYATAGLTNPPARVKRLKSAGNSREGYRFAVFARNSMPCYVCGTKIEKATVSSRRLYYCPTCQPPVVD